MKMTIQSLLITSTGESVSAGNVKIVFLNCWLEKLAA